jgi:hypothetical protein
MSAISKTPHHRQTIVAPFHYQARSWGESI